MDICYAPFPTREHGRPYYSRLMLFVHCESGMVLNVHVAEHETEGAEFVEQLMRTMEQHEVYPEQIFVSRPRLTELLKPLAHVMGAELVLVDFLEGVMGVREELKEFLV